MAAIISYVPPMQATAKKKLFIKTWGCQMNVYDSSRMADVLSPLGYETVEGPEGADMVILNTCHIREKAADKLFSELGRLREHKTAKEADGGKMVMAVAGCVAQAEGDLMNVREMLRFRRGDGWISWLRFFAFTGLGSVR